MYSFHTLQEILLRY